MFMWRNYNKGGTFLQDLWKKEHLHKPYLTIIFFLCFSFLNALLHSLAVPFPVPWPPLVRDQRLGSVSWHLPVPTRIIRSSCLINYTYQLGRPLLPFHSTPKPSDVFTLSEYLCDPVPLLLKISQKLQNKLHKLFSLRFKAIQYLFLLLLVCCQPIKPVWHLWLQYLCLRYITHLVPS